jgi:hypothetical protein
MAESTIGLFKAELVDLRPYGSTRTEAEFAVLKYTNWFNTARRDGQLDRVPSRAHQQPTIVKPPPGPGRGPEPHMTPLPNQLGFIRRQAQVQPYLQRRRVAR